MSSFARVFDYPALAPAWVSTGIAGDPEPMEPAVQKDPQAERIYALEQQIEAMTAMHARQVEQARRGARDLAMRDAAAEHQRALQAEAGRIQRSLEAFSDERAQYFRGVEHEVVRLALAVASKVLHREARMDPLLLSGAVHVALERLKDSGGVTMRVPATEVQAWEESLRLHASGGPCPQVVPDISLGAGDCVLLTPVGTVELGVSAQLQEIEKGFFDLLDRRPAARRAA